MSPRGAPESSGWYWARVNYAPGHYAWTVFRADLDGERGVVLSGTRSGDRAGDVVEWGERIIPPNE